MMIAPNSLVRQKEGRRKKRGRLSGTQTLEADAHKGLIRSGVSDRKDRREHGRWCGALESETVFSKKGIG